MAMRDLAPWRRGTPARREEQQPMDVWRQEMDRWFDRWFGGFGLAPFEGQWEGFMPRVDVTETDNEIQVSAELPGIDPQHVDVSVSHDVLTISGEKREEREEKEKNYYRTERSYGSFRRSVQLPMEVDTNRADATFKNGLLTVTIPKTEQARERKKVEVKTA